MAKQVQIVKPLSPRTPLPEIDNRSPSGRPTAN